MKKKNILLSMTVTALLAFAASCTPDGNIPPADYHFLISNTTMGRLVVKGQISTTTGETSNFHAIVAPQESTELISFVFRDFLSDSYEAAFYSAIADGTVNICTVDTEAPLRTWKYQDRKDEEHNPFRRTARSSTKVSGLDKETGQRTVYITFDIRDSDVN